MKNWYTQHIEEPIRNIVEVLRNNGFNTTCSCGHEMYVEGVINIDGELQRLHNLLYNYFFDKNINVNYDIEIKLSVQNGYITENHFYINFTK